MDVTSGNKTEEISRKVLHAQIYPVWFVCRNATRTTPSNLFENIDQSHLTSSKNVGYESTSGKPLPKRQYTKICYTKICCQLLPALVTCLFYQFCDLMGNNLSLLIPWHLVGQVHEDRSFFPACHHETNNNHQVFWVTLYCSNIFNTLPETNIAPTNGWLEYYFPIGKAYFQGLC